MESIFKSFFNFTHSKPSSACYTHCNKNLFHNFMETELLNHWQLFPNISPIKNFHEDYFD